MDENCKFFGKRKNLQSLKIIFSEIGENLKHGENASLPRGEMDALHINEVVQKGSLW